MSDVITDKIKNRDYVVVIDQSGSMSTNDTPTKKSRWEYCKESVLAIVNKVIPLDPDGIDLYLFNNAYRYFPDVNSVDKVNEVFNNNDPMGSTSFAPVLNDIFNKHFNKSQRATTVLFVTDGEASDASDTARAIIAAANKIENDNDLAISFIQVGRDVQAKEFLRRLDDELTNAGAKFDIVDTVTMDDMDNGKMTLNEVLFNAIMD